MGVVKVLFWVSLAGILWTHAGYPLAAALLARVRTREVRKDDVTPTVSVIVPAHDEESVIGARLDNLLALDYPAEQLEIVVASDGSTDGTTSRRGYARASRVCACSRCRAAASSPR